ncbi:ATPase associated with various cellular activities AAA_3 [Cordyceps javanica]|uniref:ATPase associated with various cellular activities AAA_3 n=1 Tax=Cordyceps javanica TaxID=43265 RepID=A0A545UNQ9_9HYPO|nr:ATPase associated with various cellular activities AAA_3 [Cordyceps javanica]
MADNGLIDKVHDLSDLELAVLLCLISREHCLISTPASALDELVLELQLIATKTFGLEWAVVDCSPSTTLEDFASSLLLTSPPPPDTSSGHHGGANATASYFSSSRSHHHSQQKPGTTPTRRTGLNGATSPGGGSSSPQIANFVVARNLDRAPHAVQIQALELLRTRRIFTRTTVQVAPKQFVFVPVLAAPSGGCARVTPHLNDFLSIAHWHDPEHGFVNVEEQQGASEYPDNDDNDNDDGDVDGDQDADAASTGSIVKRVRAERHPTAPALISKDDIVCLREKGQKVRVDVDVVRYQMNVVSFLRMHRAVDQGITPAATKHFGQLMRNLAPLHRLDFVTPALVGLAARKVYLHRIRITDPRRERSMQWGSRLEAVEALLQHVGPEEVLDDVMTMVTAPV